MRNMLILCLIFLSTSVGAQINILSTNPIAEQILQGDYDPSDYTSDVVIDNHEDIIEGINVLINADSLKSYLEEMSAFTNRTLDQTRFCHLRNWCRTKMGLPKI
jgi:hypothetical protein